MSRFEPRTADYRSRVEASFARQSFMTLLGARLARIAPGEVDIEVGRRVDLCQQHGFFHAGVTTSIADSASGYAAFSLFEADASVLTTELKINLMAPARGERLIARGRVLKPGRTLSVCQSDVFALDGGCETQVAVVLLTMMQMHGMADEAVTARGAS